MSSETPVKLPVIVFSKQDLKPGTPEWDLVKVQVHQAVQEYGSFEALFNEVLKIRGDIFVAIEELFDLPSETKNLCVSHKPYRGYYGKPLYERMAIDESNNVESLEQRLTNTLWPQGNTSFSKTLLSFAEIASGLEKTIRRMILESFGLDKYMDHHMDLTNYMLMLMKYEGPRNGEPTIGALPAHTDKNMVTLLYQNEANGLEIQTKDGEWIDVKPSPDSFVVIIGESFNAWLNGRLWAPYHRVIMSRNEIRYCTGLFANPRDGYKVKAPDELVDEENPRLFKPFDYYEFLVYYSKQVSGGASRPDLKAYCSS